MTNLDLVLGDDQSLETIYQSAIAGTIQPNRRKSKRYPCTAMIWVAVLEGRFPAPDDLQLAICHDVSLDGIAFYAPYIADGRRLALALSRSTDRLLEARVVGSHEIEPPPSAPEARFVIHCEFAARLHPEDFE